MKKLLLKALPLALLFLSAAMHSCCACPMEFHDEEGLGPAERAWLGAAKRKRGRGRIANYIEVGNCSVKAFLNASQISLNRL
jgi:hypothetical protein